MATEYDPKRIERTIERYKRDIEEIMKKTDNNGQEITRLRRQRANDQLSIDQLDRENQKMRDEWQKISGKIEALEELIKM